MCVSLATFFQAVRDQVGIAPSFPPIILSSSHWQSQQKGALSVIFLLRNSYLTPSNTPSDANESQVLLT